jgi:hypothetical protein
MRPDRQQIAAAIAMMSGGLVKYFPSDDAAQRIILLELERMVPTVEALDWLVDKYLRVIGEWTSLKDLRGVLCARCTPLDKIQAYSSAPGFTADDLEANWHSRQLEESTARLEEYRQQARLMGPADRTAAAQIQGAVDILAEASDINEREQREPVRMPDEINRKASREALLRAFPDQAKKEGLVQ